MKATITHYGIERKARTASGAIRAAKALIRLYGQGNRNPVIDVDNDEDAADIVAMMSVAKVQYCVRVNKQPVI